MRPGIYKKIINQNFDKTTDEHNFKDICNIDKNEVPQIISLTYEKTIGQIPAE